MRQSDDKRLRSRPLERRLRGGYCEPAGYSRRGSVCPHPRYRRAARSRRPHARDHPAASMNFSGRRSATSFSRAINYILQDKDNPETAHRVGIVQFLNLGTDDPAKEMRVTAEAARAIQARNRLQNGQRPQSSGRTPDKITYTL